MATLSRLISRRWMRRRTGCIVLFIVLLFVVMTNVYICTWQINRNLDGAEDTRIHLETVQHHATETIETGHYTRQSANTSYGRHESARRENDVRYMTSMLHTNQSFCNGDFIGFSNSFARMYNVVIVPIFGHGRTGGENLMSVANQSEDAEYYKLDKGFFSIECDKQVRYHFKGKWHLTKWMSATTSVERLPSWEAPTSRWTIAVVRYEYVNLYNAMTDFYNAFLLTKAFSLTPDDVDILWIDGHPKGSLDVTWDILFGGIYRIGDLTEPMKYQRLLWNSVGYDSRLRNVNMLELPYADEFRDFFLGRHGVKNEVPLNCNNVSVIIIWRRDYVAHPRNVNGIVSRKIKNEAELFSGVRDVLPGHSARGIQMDLLPMSEQLTLVSKADILIGMHGAGLSHVLFLPQHASVVELFPDYWGGGITHFQAMCRYRDVSYFSWRNHDHGRELAHFYTVVDVPAIVGMVKGAYRKMCGDEMH